MELEENANIYSDEDNKIEESLDEDSSSSSSSSDSGASSSKSKEDAGNDDEWEEQDLLNNISEEFSWLPPFEKKPAKPIPYEEENFFELFFTEEIFQMIADETNNYAKKLVFMRNANNTTNNTNNNCNIPCNNKKENILNNGKKKEEKKENEVIIIKDDDEFPLEKVENKMEIEKENKNKKDQYPEVYEYVDEDEIRELKEFRKQIDKIKEEKEAKLLEENIKKLEIRKAKQEASRKPEKPTQKQTTSNPVKQTSFRYPDLPQTLEEIPEKEEFKEFSNTKGKILKNFEDEDESFEEAKPFAKLKEELVKVSFTQSTQAATQLQMTQPFESSLHYPTQYLQDLQDELTEAKDKEVPKRKRKEPQKKIATEPKGKVWKETDANEIRSFIGLVLLMGIIKKPAFYDYWGKDEKLATPIFAAIMPRERFIHLLRYIHISKANPSVKAFVLNKQSRLEKVEYLLSYLKEKWNLYQTPNKHLTIDESMISFKGKIAFRQYIPRKRHQHGIKCWVMADSRSSYVHEVDIYTGKSEFSGVETDLGMKVVLDISKKLPPGHILFFDNYFTCLQLMIELTKRGIGAVGTLRRDRKGVPRSFYSLKMLKHESKCLQHKIYKNIKAINWRDAKPVYCMSNCVDYHNTEVSKYSRRSKSMLKVKKPEALAVYNIYMHGVDKVDQLASYYSFTRKSLKWWKKVFFYLIEISISNSYVLYLQNKGEKTLSRKAYRLKLIDKLFSRNQKYNEYKLHRGRVIPLHHFPLYQPLSKECYWCREFYKMKKRTKYYCEKCEVPLCIICFEWYHKYFNII